MCVLPWVVTHFLCQIAHSGPFSAQEKSLSFRLLPLIDLLFSIPPAPTSKFTWFICAHLGWPAARKWEQLYCPNWTEGNWLVSGGDCLDWPVCSRKMLRQHLSTWDSLLIGKWCKLCPSLREWQEKSCLGQQEREIFKRYDAPNSCKAILENICIDSGLGAASWVYFVQVTCLLLKELEIALCQEMS